MVKYPVIWQYMTNVRVTFYWVLFSPREDNIQYHTQFTSEVRGCKGCRTLHRDALCLGYRIASFTVMVYCVVLCYLV